ncbi:MAG TPA: hypothetical protein VJ440_10755 [Candidatus Brocadiaceae bacterium]|nr:hypothetical protein [Candidatus Brocadiaceae bacterium]
MSPLSIVPGRLRFENWCLIGKAHVCECLQQRIGEIAGVIETSANQRTGRVLVWYDDKHIDGQDLARLIDRIVSQQMASQLYRAFLSQKENANKGEKVEKSCSYKCGARKFSHGNGAGLGRNWNAGNRRILDKKESVNIPFTGAAIHAVMDVVAHAVLPKPLNVFAPLLIKALTAGRG